MLYKSLIAVPIKDDVALFRFFKKRSTVSLKGEFSRHLWLYGLISTTRTSEKALKDHGFVHLDDAHTLLIRNSLLSRVRKQNFVYRYSTADKVESLNHIHEERHLQRLLWVMPELSEFTFTSKSELFRFFNSSPRKAQIYASLKPLLALSNTLPTLNLVAWYVCVREQLEKVFSQPLSIVPIVNSHPRFKNVLTLAGTANECPTGCSPAEDIDNYATHPILRHLFVDLFHTLRQLASEPVTHARLRMAIEHTQRKARTLLIELLNAKNKTHNASLPKGSRSYLPRNCNAPAA